MSPLRRTMPQDQRDATKHLTFSEREANRDANENFKLGRAAARKKDHAAAMLHYHMALKLQREIMGHEHPIVAATLNDIGLTLMEAGDIDGAQAALQEALYIRQEELRDVADDVAATLQNLSTLQDVAFAPPSKVANSSEFPPTRNRLVLQDAVFDHAIEDGIVEHSHHHNGDDDEAEPAQPVAEGISRMCSDRHASAHTSALDAPLQLLGDTLTRSLEISEVDIKLQSQPTGDDDCSTIATASTSLSSKNTNTPEQERIASNGATNRISLFSSWFQRRDTCGSQPKCSGPQKKGKDVGVCSNAAKTA